jgi:hypothetical protein
MRAKIKGSILLIAKPRQLFAFICFLTCGLVVFTNLSVSQDQQQASKPKLAAITFDQNNEEALAIAKKLDPDFFTEDTAGFDVPEYIARYIPLDPENPKRFIAVTARNSLYYCTNYGCPYYIYMNARDNKWKLVLSLQAHGLYHDVTTKSDRPDNIISEESSQATRELSVWMWNGQEYSEAVRK